MSMRGHPDVACTSWSLVLCSLLRCLPQEHVARYEKSCKPALTGDPKRSALRKFATDESDPMPPFGSGRQLRSYQQVCMPPPPLPAHLSACSPWTEAAVGHIWGHP
jgi:hypothetical protein